LSTWGGALCRLCWLIAATLCAAGPLGHAWGASTPETEIQILSIDADSRGGKAYRMIYEVPVDAGTYWRFKTDFENDLLVSNKYIKSHLIVSSEAQKVVSESIYSYDPEHAFRWETTVRPEQRRLEFRLLNAKECNQIFHYGAIQVEAAGSRTRVTQTAYFDFWGVGLWFHYPWSGGMREFLRYNARWEQRLAAQLKRRYPPPAHAPGGGPSAQFD
jgi:hypothetical protein